MRGMGQRAHLAVVGLRREGELADELVDDGAHALLVVGHRQPLDQLLHLQRRQLALLVQLVADLPQHRLRQQLAVHAHHGGTAGGGLRGVRGEG
jgi:hypothetical protein